MENIPEMLDTGRFVYFTNKIVAKYFISQDYKLTGKCNYYISGDLAFGALAMPFAVSVFYSSKSVQQWTTFTTPRVTEA